MAGFTESGFDCKLWSSRNDFGLRRDSFIFACGVRLLLSESEDILASFVGSVILELERDVERAGVRVFALADFLGAMAFLAFEVARVLLEVEDALTPFAESILDFVFFIPLADFEAELELADLVFDFLAALAAVGFLATLVAMVNSLLKWARC